jgi:hypothetical protein
LRVRERGGQSKKGGSGAEDREEAHRGVVLG